MNLINIRDGGVNGVKLVWDECETQYEVERGVECYERLKTRPNVAAWNPLSVGIAYAMIDRITADKVPLITVNHGRTDSTDGRVFPYVFPLLLNPYSETSGIINYLASREGGIENLKGKKIVVLYHGSPYGKETIPIYELLSEKFGFEVQQIEVPHPGNEQQSQWLSIRRAKPDYVVLRGWGVMNPVALKTAQKTGFPVDHIIGNVWSNSEADVVPAGDAAKGYIAITTQASGAQYPVLQEVVKTVYDQGKGNLQDPEADRQRLPQPRHRERHPQCRGGADRPGQVRQPHAHRRRGPLGLRESAARPEAGRGAGRQGPVPLDQRHLRQPRGRRPRHLPAVGWREVAGGERLDCSGLGAAAADHREVRGGLRGREQHHAARLLESAGRAELSLQRGRASAAPPQPILRKDASGWPRPRPCSSRATSRRPTIRASSPCAVSA